MYHFLNKELWLFLSPDRKVCMRAIIIKLMNLIGILKKYRKWRYLGCCQKAEM